MARRGPALALAALLAWPVCAGAAGARHPAVAGRAVCVTRECHPGLLEAARRAGGGSAHAPAADGECGSCHDLGLDAGTRFVKGAPAGGGDGPERARAWDLELCLGCHDEALAAKDAPPGTTAFTDGPRNLHALHVQAARGRRCLTCHGPHGSRQAKLLRERIPGQGSVRIPQEFRPEKNGGWCRTGCHAPKRYTR